MFNYEGHRNSYKTQSEVYFHLTQILQLTSLRAVKSQYRYVFSWFFIFFKGIPVAATFKSGYFRTTEQ